MPTPRRTLLLLVLALLLAPSLALAQASVIVVRHAERADSSEDSPLSAAGLARAQRLAGTLSRIRLSTIYVTTRARTRQTAEPTAKAQGLEMTALGPQDIDGLVSAIGRARATDHVLVVGHSNTLPDILRRLGVAEPTTIADDDFGNIFVVVPENGNATLIRLRY